MSRFFDESISPWRAGLSYFSSMLIILLAGCGYSFASYSPAIASQFKITHTQTGLVYTMGMFGGIGVTAGWVADHAGLRRTLLVGTFLASGGWTAAAASSAGLIHCSFSVLLLSYMLAQQGLIMLYMGAFLNIKNVHRERKGAGLGVLDTCYGLGPVLFSQIYGLLFDRNRPPIEQDLPEFFALQAAAVLCCGLAGAATSYVPSHKSDAQDARSALACKAGIRSLDFWLLFLIIFLCNMAMGWHAGSLGLQLETLSSSLNPSSMNSLFMASGVIARTLAGVASDHLPVERASLLCIFLVPASVAFALLAFFGEDAFLPTAIIIGISFGSSWCLVPLQIADLFGPGFASLWGLALVGAALGPLHMQPIDSFVWSSGASTSGICSGLHCYQLTYVCASFFCGLCAALSAIVSTRRSQARVLDLSSPDYFKLEPDYFNN